MIILIWLLLKQFHYSSVHITGWRIIVIPQIVVLKNWTLRSTKSWCPWIVYTFKFQRAHLIRLHTYSIEEGNNFELSTSQYKTKVLISIYLSTNIVHWYLELYIDEFVFRSHIIYYNKVYIIRLFFSKITATLKHSWPL